MLSRRSPTPLALVCSIALVALVQPGSLAQAQKPELARATFAGGCFWCMEPPFDKIAGVVSTTSGYAGGRTKNPTYEQVSAGGTGHAEVVQIVYDPESLREYFATAGTRRHVAPMTCTDDK